MGNSPDLRQEILKQLDRLPTEQQRQVLVFVQALAVSRPKGVPGKELQRFAGVLSEDEAKAWVKTIESESSLKRDWLRPEEDEAWQSL